MSCSSPCSVYFWLLPLSNQSFTAIGYNKGKDEFFVRYFHVSIDLSLIFQRNSEEYNLLLNWLNSSSESPHFGIFSNEEFNICIAMIPKSETRQVHVLWSGYHKERCPDSGDLRLDRYQFNG